jgi:hypothetical protein
LLRQTTTERPALEVGSPGACRCAPPDEPQDFDEARALATSGWAALTQLIAQPASTRWSRSTGRDSRPTPTNESKQTRYPLTDCALPVTIEFRMTADRGDQRPAIEAERVLGEIRRRIGEDRTLGGLALDVREIGNDVDLDTYADKAIEGAVFLEVRYRHATDDPRASG